MEASGGSAHRRRRFWSDDQGGSDCGRRARGPMRGNGGPAQRSGVGGGGRPLDHGQVPQIGQLTGLVGGAGGRRRQLRLFARGCASVDQLAVLGTDGVHEQRIFMNGDVPHQPEQKHGQDQREQQQPISAHSGQYAPAGQGGQAETAAAPRRPEFGDQTGRGCVSPWPKREGTLGALMYDRSEAPLDAVDFMEEEEVYSPEEVMDLGYEDDDLD